MLTIEALKEWGANTDEGVARCVNSVDFYLSLVGRVVDDKGFEDLKTALEANDLDAAFQAAHGLKGILGNLSLTPVYDKVVEITELLRSRTEMDYSEMLASILEDQQKLKDMMNN